MQESLRVKDAVEFFFANRENKFQDWTYEDTTITISEAINDGLFAWTCDNEGRITGIALGSKREDAIHVSAIIIKKPEKLKTFIEYFKKAFPNTKLTGYRKDKLVYFRRIYVRSKS